MFEAGNKQKLRGNHRKISLFWVLSFPFILQIVAVVSSVGYLSYRNGKNAVEDLTEQLMDAVSRRIEAKLNSFLDIPLSVNQNISDAVSRGALKLDFDREDSDRERYLWQTMRSNSNFTWISVGTQQGNTIGIWRPQLDSDLQVSLSNKSTKYFGAYYATDDRGLRTKILKVEYPAFDPRPRPWYKEAVAAKKPIWTQIYAGFTPGTIFIAASRPLYSENKQLLGVSAIDLSLTDIQNFLIQIEISPSSQIFIIEESGSLVATSSEEQPFRLVDEKPQRVEAIDSNTFIVRATSRMLQQQLGDFSKIEYRKRFLFEIDRQKYFVQVLPFSKEGGLDWKIAIVVPEKDVMARVHLGNNTTVLLCILAAAIVIVLNILFSRSLVRPIAALSRASQAITRGDFTRKLHFSRIGELFILADSFDRMSREILQSRQQLEEYSRSLEQKVADRTRELQEEIQRRAIVEIELQSANEKLQDLAYVDGLTQIPNRRRFDERLELEWARLKRDRLPLSLIICDVDYFKQYNDAYGHQGGDDCLCLVSQALVASVRRPPDLAARYGGEEFVLLLPNTHLEGAIEVARLARENVRNLQIRHKKSQVSEFVTASFGIASTIPSDTATSEELLSQADEALYRAKSQGRDRFAY